MPGRLAKVARWAVAVAVLVVGLGATELWACREINDRRVQATSAAEDLGSQLKSRLEAGAEPTYYTTHALDVFLRGENGALKAGEIRTFLDGLYAHGRFTRSIAVAPASRIEFIEPIAENRSAIGLSYADQPSQWPGIKAEIDGAAPTLSGPIDLVQGGRGFAYRLPVYIPDGTYWGIASTVMDADAYLSESTAIAAETGITTALRPVAANGVPGEVFWGDPATFSGQPTLVQVQPLGAQWQLGLTPNAIDTTAARNIRIFGFVLSGLVALLVFALIGSRQRRTELSRRLTRLSSHAPGALFQLRMHPDGSSSLPFASEGVEDLFGIAPQTLKHDAAPLWSRVVEEDEARVRDTLLRSAESGQPWHERIRMLDRNGEQRWFLADASPEVADADGFLWHGFLTDVTTEVAAEDSIRVSASVFDSTRDGVVIMNSAGHIVDVNPAFTDLTGYTLDGVHGQSLEMFGVGLTPAAVHADIAASLAKHGFWRGELANRTVDGFVVTQAVAVSAVLDESGDTSHLIAVFSSLNANRDDVVTGLPNRQILDDQLAQSVDRAQSGSGMVALIVVSLDHFRDINESFGHRVGDVTLKDAGQRLRRVVPGIELVARHGADEFAIVLQHAADATAVEQVASNAIEALSEPFSVGNHLIHLSASAGISVLPADTTTAAGLITNANQAMRIAKDQGRNRFCYFTPAMQDEARDRARLTEDLRLAIAGNQLRIVFQPIVELTTGRICKAEALLRWEHPERGPIGPVVFIPIAERSGLIGDLGDWVFTQTLAMVQRIRRIDPTFEISFNMSPREVGSGPELHQRRLQQMRDAGVPGAALVVEITEGLILDRSEVAAENLHSYRAAGLKFALDDFGTGYSSLSYLQELDVDYLKIDRSFISEIQQNPDSLALCQAMIEMAHKLKLRVIAEGIETTEQRDVLASAKCELGQGYLFSRPIPGDELLATVTSANVV